MHLIHYVLPAVHPFVGQGGCRPDALERDHVVRVGCAHGVVQAGVDLFVGHAALGFGGVHVAHRLVEQVVHRYRRVALIARGDGGPELVGQLAVPFARGRIGVQRAGDPLAGVRRIALIAGRAVHIEDHVKAAFGALVHNEIKARKIPFAVFVQYLRAVVVVVEIAEPEGDPHAVEAHGGDLVEVFGGKEIVLIGIHQRVGPLAAEALLQLREHVVVIGGLFVGAEPVLKDQPPADVHAPERHLFAPAVHKVPSLYGKKILVRKGGAPRPGGKAHRQAGEYHQRGKQRAEQFLHRYHSRICFQPVFYHSCIDI